MTGKPLNRAVMERRTEAVDSLDFFPTPPWATRALFEHLGDDWRNYSCWEPAAGEGHMAEVLRTYFKCLYASDVHDYGCGYSIGSFVGVGPDVAQWPHGNRPDWIITNPPFNEAEAFLERALPEATVGVALLLRTNWLDSQGRYDRIFASRAPTRVLQFADRVPMVKGRWDPRASTATAYAWFIWDKLWGIGPKTRTWLAWIPTGAPTRCSRSDDVARFAKWLAMNCSEACVDGNQADFWGM